jgi:non-ribosomal peptide synthetase component F
LVQIFTETAQIICADRTLLVFSASATASYRSIYCALLKGASLHIVPPPLNLGPTALSQEIRARGITIYRSVPTLMRRKRVSAANDSIRFGSPTSWGPPSMDRRGRVQAVLFT